MVETYDDIVLTKEHRDGISVMFPTEYRPYKDVFTRVGVDCAKKQHCNIIKVFLNKKKQFVCIPMSEVDLSSNIDEE